MPSAPTPRRTAPAGSRSSQYFGRGFDLEQGPDFSVSFDGIPMNLPSHVRGSGYLDLGFLIPETLAGLRYFRGPYRAEQGAFAVAGSANLEAVDRFPAPFASVGFGGAAGDRFARLLLGGSGGQGDRVTYALEGTRTYRPWNEFDASAKLNAFLRVAPGGLALGPTWSLTLLLMEEKGDGGSAAPDRPRAGDFQDRFGDLGTGDGVRTRRLLAGLQNRVDRGGGVSDRLQLYAGLSSQRTWVNNTYYLRDPQWGDQVRQEDRRAFLGADWSRQWVVRKAGVEWTHRAGLQARLDLLAEASVLPTCDRERIAGKAPLLEAKGDLFHGAAHAQTTARWAEGWRAFLGARVDTQWNRLRGPGPGLPGDRTATLVSPKAGLAYSPMAGTEFHASWGQGFRLGNALRDSRPMTRVRSVDVGAQTRLLAPWETSLTLWQLDLDAESLFSPAENAWLQAGAARHRGLEWFNEVKWGPWHAEACLGWSKARFRDGLPGGDRVPNSIPRTGVLALGWKGSAVGVEVKYRSLGAYALTRDNSVTAGREESLEFKLEREWGPWGAGVSVINAFGLQKHNAQYHYLSKLPEEASGVLGRHVKLTDPQAIRVELRRRF